VLLNLSRARELLENCQLDALIATSWVNVLYCSDFYLWLLPAFKRYMATPGDSSALLSMFAIVTSEGNGALVLDRMYEESSQASWIANRHFYGSAEPVPRGITDEGCVDYRRHHPTVIAALASALRAESLSGARLGVEMDSLSRADRDALREAVPGARILDASNVFRVLRMVKTESEVERLRRAARINEHAAVAALARVCEGVAMADVVHGFRTAVAAEGASLDHFAFSRHGRGFTTDPGYRFGGSETMFVDFGCVYENYHSDAGVTLMRGVRPLHVEHAYRVMADCVTMAAAELRPGSRASSIQAVMQRHCDTEGLPGHFPHGHGIGLEIREYPILVPETGLRIRDECIDWSADPALEEGMVINLEVPVFGLGEAALQLEQTYVVTSEGGEPLTDRDLAQPVLAE
jgi:Xaa-Pro dipeptidase